MGNVSENGKMPVLAVLHGVTATCRRRVVRPAVAGSAGSWRGGRRVPLRELMGD